jgi:hypothetical protein
MRTDNLTVVRCAINDHLKEDVEYLACFPKTPRDVMILADIPRERKSYNRRSPGKGEQSPILVEVSAARKAGIIL